MSLNSVNPSQLQAFIVRASQPITFRQQCIKDFMALYPKRYVCVDIRYENGLGGELVYNVMTADYSAIDSGEPELRVGYRLYSDQPNKEFLQLMEV